MFTRYDGRRIRTVCDNNTKSMPIQIPPIYAITKSTLSNQCEAESTAQYTKVHHSTTPTCMLAPEAEADISRKKFREALATLQDPHRLSLDHRFGGVYATSWSRTDRTAATGCGVMNEGGPLWTRQRTHRRRWKCVELILRFHPLGLCSRSTVMMWILWKKPAGWNL